MLAIFLSSPYFKDCTIILLKIVHIFWSSKTILLQKDFSLILTSNGLDYFFPIAPPLHCKSDQRVAHLFVPCSKQQVEWLNLHYQKIMQAVFIYPLCSYAWVIGRVWFCVYAEIDIDRVCSWGHNRNHKLASSFPQIITYLLLN